MNGFAFVVGCGLMAYGVMHAGGNVSAAVGSLARAVTDAVSAWSYWMGRRGE